MTEFGWSRAQPIQKKGDEHETFSLFFKSEGVPPKMVMYGSKDKTLGSFSKKCQDVDYHIKQTETYSPWQLQAEGNIRELKKGAGRKMVQYGAPMLFGID